MDFYMFKDWYMHFERINRLITRDLNHYGTYKTVNAGPMSADILAPGHHELTLSFVVPDDFAGACLRMSAELPAACDTVFFSVAGRSIVFDRTGEFVSLQNCCAGKEAVTVYAQFTNISPCAAPSLLFSACFPLYEEVYACIREAHKAAAALDETAKARFDIIETLNSAVNLLDLREPYSPAFHDSMLACRDFLNEHLFTGGAGEPRSVCGIAHIRPEQGNETGAAAVRVLAAALTMLDENPEMRLLIARTDLLYAAEKADPGFFATVVSAVKGGRLEPACAMWTDADCRVLSGESLIRQFTAAADFMKTRFGKAPEVLWLPDCPAFPAALPMLMRMAGVKYLVTAGPTRADYNRLPCDFFKWQGFDGTITAVYFLPAVAREKALEGIVATTADAPVDASTLQGAWLRFQQRDLTGTLMIAAAPNAAAADNARVLSRGLPGTPVFSWRSASAFLSGLTAQQNDNPLLPLWRGEIPCESQRAALSTSAALKRGNRMAENGLTSAEALTLMASVLTGCEPPHAVLDACQRTILSLQNRTLLSAPTVSAKALEVLSRTVSQLETEIKKAAAQIASQLSGMGFAAFNGAGSPAFGLIKLPDCKACALRDPGGRIVPVQRRDGNAYIAACLPAMSYTLYTPVEGCESGMTANYEDNRIDTPFYHIQINGQGEFSSLIDKTSGREVLPAGMTGNRLSVYRCDSLREGDLSLYYTEAGEPAAFDGIELVDNGPVFARFALKFHYRSSVIIQQITVYRDFPGIDIAFELDWRTAGVLLKYHASINAHAFKWVSDAPFGYTERTSHQNTSWDWAHFEACGCRWAGIFEEGFGAILANDGRYGYSCLGKDLALTLLCNEESAAKQTVRCRLLPCSSFKAPDALAAAAGLNAPPFCVRAAGGGTLPDSFTLITSDASNIAVSAATPLAPGRMLLRLCDGFGRAGSASVRMGFHPVAVSRCGPDGTETGTCDIVNGCINLAFKPFEIKNLLVHYTKPELLRRTPMLTPRENVIRAIRFSGPERIPVDLPEQWGSDFIFTGQPKDPLFVSSVEGADEWGCVWEKIAVGDKTMGQVRTHPLTDYAQLDSYPFPDYTLSRRYQTQAEKIGKNAGVRFVVAGLPCSLSHRPEYLRGVEAALTDPYEYPDEFGRLLDIITKTGLDAMDHYARIGGIDGVFFCDDWGLQDRAMVSPQIFNEFYKPRYARIFGRAHEYGMIAMMHSCGHIVDLLDSLIDAGLDVIQMDQQENMGLELLDKRFGGRICFWCPVDIQNTMIRGSVADVECYARRLIDTFGKYNGGFLAQYYKSPAAVNHTQEKLDAMSRVFVEYGKRFYLKNKKE